MSENMVVMVFTDLVNSTAIIKHLSDEDTIARDRIYRDTILGPHRQRVENSIAKYGGRKNGTEGDSYFLVFANPTEAVRWAVEVQNSHTSDPIVTPLGPLAVRIGMHIGSPLSQGDNLVGYDIHYAARVGALATGGQILLSEAMAALVRAASIKGWKLHDHGERDLKGIGKEPIFELLYADKKPQPLKDGIKVAPDTKRKNRGGETKAVTSGVEKRHRPQINRIAWFVPLLLGSATLVGIVGMNSSYIPDLCDRLSICAQYKWEVKYYKADNQAKTARELDQKAKDYDDLKKAHDHMEKAVTQLQSIPPNATIYSEVQKVLPGYKQQLEKMKKGIKTDIFQRQQP